ncbi:DciA family protein [Streptomyces xanthochromogenes]|uniref:DciA family protein n=1 Tax=Streptomyces xanthochromogenes TaxID=67384 RepID=UPI0034123CD9
MNSSGEDEVAEQTPEGQDLARIALRNAIQGARYNRGRTQRRRSRQWSRSEGPRLVPVKVTVAEVADYYGWPMLVETAVLSQWPTLAGDVGKGIIPVRFDPVSGVLSLRGISPAYGTAARFRSPEIMHAVNEALGQQAVRAIAVLSPAPAKPPAPPLPPRAFRHQEPPLQEDDHLVLAARRRQAAQAPREPGHLFTPDDFWQAARGDLVRARAVARARAARGAPS